MKFKFRNYVDLKNSLFFLFKKHYIKFVFSIYWLFILFITSIFLYLSLKSVTYINFYAYLIISIIILILGIIGHRYFYKYIKINNPLINLMTSFMLIVAYLSGLLTYLILLLFSDLLEKLPNFRFFGDEGDWINFIGIIIAGLITMLGITITITNNQKIRDEDNKNELLPIVELKIISYSEKTQKPSKNFEIMSPWFLEISNIGEKPARNLKMTNLEAWFHNTETDSKKINISYFNLESLKTNLLAVDRTHEIQIQIPLTELPQIHYKYLRLFFKLEYYDLTLKNVHYHSATFNLELEGDKEYFLKHGYKFWNLSSLYNQFID